MADLKVTVTLDDRGLKVMRDALRNGHPAITKGLRDAGYILMDFWRRRFDSQPWPPVKPSTQIRKSKYGYGSTTLYATGQLYNVIDPNIKGQVPGRNFTVTKKSVTVGYGGSGQYSPENAYTRAVGSVARLANIQQEGLYREGTERVIIVNPDNSTMGRMRRRLQESINTVVRGANNAS